MDAQCGPLRSGAARMGRAGKIGIAGCISLMIAAPVWWMPEIRDLLLGKNSLFVRTPATLAFDYVCAAWTCISAGTALLGLRQAGAAELRRKRSNWWCLGSIAFAVGITVAILAVRRSISDPFDQNPGSYLSPPPPDPLARLAPLGLAIAYVSFMAVLFDAGRMWVARRAERAAEAAASNSRA
jgi:hypothetical protein